MNNQRRVIRPEAAWRRSLKVVYAFIVMGMTSLVLGQPDIVVDYPVAGLLARTFGGHYQLGQLGIANPSNGTWTAYEITPSYQVRPFWSNDGRFLALSLPGSGSGILDMQTNTVMPISDIDSPFQGDQLSHAQGWSHNDQSLLFRHIGLPSDGSINVLLYDLEIATNTSSLIYQWQSGMQLTDLPLPPNATSIELRGSGQVERNPVYDRWLLIQLEASGFFSDTPTCEPINGDTNVLWNYETAQGISLDSLVPDLYIWPYRSDWSRDGTKLLLNAISRNLRQSFILTIHFTPETGAVLVERAVVENRIAEHWLDAGDIFFSSVLDVEGADVYVLGEIVDGEYQERPFFTLQGEGFEAITYSDWYLLDDDTERSRHSCMFDRALSSRLAVNDQLSLVVAHGIGLPLREEPSEYTAQVANFDEETSATVMGGPACSGGYRWWQVELTDGMVGWITEADANEYFIEVTGVR